MDPDGTIRLLSAILAGVAHLPGAACRGHHELFDEIGGHDFSAKARAQREARRGAAQRLCRSCPARPACPAR